MQLSDIQNTAWLTLYCRSRASLDQKYPLKDLFAEWAIQEKGIPEYVNSINRRVLKGVPLRTLCVDECIREEIEKAKKNQSTINYWALACGFDARWQRFQEALGSTIGKYYEFDYQNLLAYKKALISKSPFNALYGKVQHHSGDIIGQLPGSIPRSDVPTLIVLEGIMMYFNEAQQRALLAAIKERVPRATLVLDLYSSLAVKMANRKSRTSTGSSQVLFAWGPKNISEYLVEQGWNVTYRVSLLQELYRSANLFTRLMPLPAKLAASYVLLKITT
jgi:O-methyltransferase involved in polyketide biosynthesis